MSALLNKLGNVKDASFSNLADSQKIQNNKPEQLFQALLKTIKPETDTDNPADSGFQTGDFKWSEKDLISYYDVDKDGIVDEKDINEGLIKPKDINHDGVLDLKDFIKAFTVGILQDKEPDQYKQYLQVAENAFKLKDLNNDGVIDINDWDTNGDKKVSGKELMEKMDLNHDGVFTAEDTKVRQQMVFGQK